MPKRIRCSPAPPSRSARIRSSRGGCAIIAPCTCSTRAMPRRALEELDKPLPKAVPRTRATAGQASRSTPSPPGGSTPISKLGQQLGAQSDELLPAEKAEILDAQALQLRGTSLRLTGDLASRRRAAQRRRQAPGGPRRQGRLDPLDARPDPRRSRGHRGRPKNTARGRAPLPPGRRRCSKPIIRARPRLLNAKARLAGYLARTGQRATAEAMFREIVHSQPDAGNLPPSFAHVLRPYVDLLLKKRGDPGRHGRDFRRHPADGPARPCPDPGGARARAQRRHRRGVAPVPPVGDPYPPDRARPDRACPASRIPKPTPEDRARLRMVQAALDTIAEGAALDPVGAGCGSNGRDRSALRTGGTFWEPERIAGRGGASGCAGRDAVTGRGHMDEQRQ